MDITHYGTPKGLQGIRDCVVFSKTHNRAILLILEVFPVTVVARAPSEGLESFMLTPRDDKMHRSFSHQTKADGVCKTRMDLLDRLAGAVERLGRAKLSLETAGQKAEGREKHAVRDHADALRNECGTIRSELEYHRFSHGC